MSFLLFSFKREAYWLLFLGLLLPLLGILLAIVFPSLGRAGWW